MYRHKFCYKCLGNSSYMYMYIKCACIDLNKFFLLISNKYTCTHVPYMYYIYLTSIHVHVCLFPYYFLLQPKCFKYWPNQGGKAYGNIVVRVDRDIVLPFYTIRSFKLIDVSCVSYHVQYMHIKNKIYTIYITCTVIEYKYSTVL